MSDEKRCACGRFVIPSDEMPGQVADGVLHLDAGTVPDTCEVARLRTEVARLSAIPRMPTHGKHYDSEAGTCSHCHGVGACPECWGRVGIDRMAAERDAAIRRVEWAEELLQSMDDTVRWWQRRAAFLAPSPGDAPTPQPAKEE